MHNRLLIWGKGGHSSVVCEQLRDWNPPICIDDMDAYQILDEWRTHCSRKDAFVAIGDNYIRFKKTKIFLQYGFNLINIISSSTFIASNIEIGKGSFIAPMVCLQPKVIIGNGVIVNTGATIDHDCCVGDFTHIAPGAHLCGGINIGSRCLVSVGSSIIPDINICDDVIIGAGATVVKDINTSGTYVGTPAKRIK